MNVRTLCLGVLSAGEASGYQIKKEIEEGLFSHFIDASYGSIYPALTQLAGEGLVTVRAEEQSGKPDKKGLFNNAAQVWNHTFYWSSMKPGGGGDIALFDLRRGAEQLSRDAPGDALPGSPIRGGQAGPFHLHFRPRGNARRSRSRIDFHGCHHARHHRTRSS